MKVSPQYVSIQVPLECNFQGVHCPLCGRLWSGQGSFECDHLAVVHNPHTIGYLYLSEDFKKRCKEVGITFTYPKRNVGPLLKKVGKNAFISNIDDGPSDNVDGDLGYIFHRAGYGGYIVIVEAILDMGNPVPITYAFYFGEKTKASSPRFDESKWAHIIDTYKEGQKITGRVTGLADFGAFVALEDGIEGLVRISQISDAHIENVKDVLNIGDQVEARIINIDPVSRRIDLSIKAAKGADKNIKVSDEPQEGSDDLASAFNSLLADKKKGRSGRKLG